MNFPIQDINGKDIHYYEVLNVYDDDLKLVGWGWFEYDPEYGSFFREDIHNLLPQGMDTDVIDNIFNFKFEKYES